MGHRSDCPPRWKAEREGERAQAAQPAAEQAQDGELPDVVIPGEEYRNA